LAMARCGTVIAMREPRAGLKCVRSRFVSIVPIVLLSALSLAGCLPDPTQPDLAAREPFARSVVAAAASGSVEQVEKLVPKVFVSVRPDAQRLVDSTRGWDPTTVQLRLSNNDFPEFARVEALKPGGTEGPQFTISWVDGHWTLVLGTSSYKPTGNAVPGPPGTGTPKVIDPPRNSAGSDAPPTRCQLLS
jgi:hypothetical protein